MNLFERLGQKFANFLGESNELDHLTENKGAASESLSDFLDPDYLAELLCFRLYDSDRQLYENKTTFGFVLEVTPILGASLDTQIEIGSLIRDLGEEGANIQCLLFADHRIDRFVDTWGAPRHEQGGLFSNLADRKKKFIQEQAFQADVPPRIFRFLLSFSQKKPRSQNLAPFLDRMVEKRIKAKSVFSRLSLVFDVKPLQLIELLSGIVNFDLSTQVQSRPSWDTNNWISKQICQIGTALEVKKSGLVFHGLSKQAEFKSFEVFDLPDQWSLNQTGELIGDFMNASYRLPTPFYIHYGIHFPSQQKIETRFQGKLKILEHQSKFPYLVRMYPKMPREIEENLFVKEQILAGEKLVETRLTCGLWGEKERLVKATSTIKALFLKYGFRLAENHFIHLPEFLSSLPMAWGEDASYISRLKRLRCMRTTLTTEIANLIPCVGEWWGNSNRGMLLTGRRGQLCSWDPFATEGNLNTVVVGPSGSGKSVFMQEMIMNHLGQGGRVFVLDLGRSFEKLCHLLDGQYLEFSDTQQFNLNPFSFIESEKGADAIHAELEMVSSIIATMVMPTQKIDKERAGIIHNVVKAAWESEGSSATVDTLLRLVKEMQFSSELMRGATESILEGLKKYGRDGAFARVLYGTQKIHFTSKLVVIETEELKNMPDLQAVILQIFTLVISDQIFMGDRNQRCLICIDEAWDLLKSPQMEGFIENLARRLRKYNGALVVGTQSVKDFERSAGAKAAFQNSNWLVLLGKDTDSINALEREKLISMDARKIAALSSLRMEMGRYSELWIHHKSSDASNICQLKLDPFSSILYSTKADEFQAIEKLKKQGKTLQEACEWFLEHKNTFDI